MTYKTHIAILLSVFAVSGVTLSFVTYAQSTIQSETAIPSYHKTMYRVEPLGDLTAKQLPFVTENKKIVQAQERLRKQYGFSPPVGVLENAFAKRDELSARSVDVHFKKEDGTEFTVWHAVV